MSLTKGIQFYKMYIYQILISIQLQTKWFTYVIKLDIAFLSAAFTNIHTTTKTSPFLRLKSPLWKRKKIESFLNYFSFEVVQMILFNTVDNFQIGTCQNAETISAYVFSDHFSKFKSYNEIDFNFQPSNLVKIDIIENSGFNLKQKSQPFNQFEYAGCCARIGHHQIKSCCVMRTLSFWRRDGNTDDNGNLYLTVSTLIKSTESAFCCGSVYSVHFELVCTSMQTVSPIYMINCTKLIKLVC